MPNITFERKKEVVEKIFKEMLQILIPYYKPIVNNASQISMSYTDITIGFGNLQYPAVGDTMSNGQHKTIVIVDATEVQKSGSQRIGEIMAHEIVHIVQHGTEGIAERHGREAKMPYMEQPLEKEAYSIQKKGLEYFLTKTKNLDLFKYLDHPADPPGDSTQISNDPMAKGRAGTYYDSDVSDSDDSDDDMPPPLPSRNHDKPTDR